MFAQRKVRRRLAGQMLLVWLFALTSGIVNACVVATERGHVTAYDSLADHASGSHACQHPCGGGTHLPGEPLLHADKLPCAKFCVDDSASVAPSKQQADPLQTVWLAPPPSQAVDLQTARESGRDHRVARGHDHARVPIAIALLRLTL